MSAVVVNVCATGRDQTIAIACLEQRFLRASVRSGHRRCSGVVHIVVLVGVAVRREEQVPRAFTVQEGRCFDDALVGETFVVQDGRW